MTAKARRGKQGFVTLLVASPRVRRGFTVSEQRFGLPEEEFVFTKGADKTHDIDFLFVRQAYSSRASVV